MYGRHLRKTERLLEDRLGVARRLEARLVVGENE